MRVWVRARRQKSCGPFCMIPAFRLLRVSMGVRSLNSLSSISQSRPKWAGLPSINRFPPVTQATQTHHSVLTKVLSIPPDWFPFCDHLFCCFLDYSMRPPCPDRVPHKILTPAQQAWLDGVIQSMKNTINRQEPVDDLRSPLQKALDDDRFLASLHYCYEGAMLEARSMQLSKDQMPDLYALWVDRRAAMGRGIQGLLLWMGQAQQMTSLSLQVPLPRRNLTLSGKRQSPEVK